MKPDLIVEITEPSFHLQRKVGGPAANILTAAKRKSAEEALLKVIPPVADEVRRLLDEMQEAIRRRAHCLRDLVWSSAHEIRGLAGTTGRNSLGQAANLMCHYLNDTDSDFNPDPNIVATISVVAMHAVHETADKDPMVRTLLVDCAKAVIAQRNREGRGRAD